MFQGLDALAAVVDEVVVAPTGEAIAEARRLLDRLETEVATAECEYSKAGGYELDGFGTMASFLRHECAMTTAESNRMTIRAKKLAQWPDVLTAWTEGRVTGTQVEVMTAKIPDRHVERFAVTAGETIDILRPLSTAQTQKAIRHWSQLADDFARREAAEAGRDPSEAVPDRELSAARSLDDRLETRGSFDPDSASYVEAALLAAERSDRDGERRTPLQRRADALVELCRFYLAYHQKAKGSGRPDRNVIVADIVVFHRAILRGAGVHTAQQLEAFLDADPDMGHAERGLFLEAFDGTADVARTLDGHPVTDALLRHVTTNGILERLLTAQGRILDHGRSVRAFTEPQKRAMAARDTGGRTDDSSPWRAHAHHSPPVDEGGTTDVNRGYLKSPRDHLTHHRDGYTDRLEPDGTLHLTTPDGNTRTTRPPGWNATPALPIHTTSRPAPRMRPAMDNTTEASVEEVADDDLIVVTTTINGEFWFVIAETPQELADTITSMTTAA